MDGLTPLFNMSDIDEMIDSKIIDSKKAVYDSFVYIGEQFINDAKNTQTYQDDTGNLRASIGYAIFDNGKTKKFRTSSRSASEGRIESAEFVEKMSQKLNKGLVLMCFAGMEYAASVESKGYDVITGSTPTSLEIGNTLLEFLS